MSTAHSVESFGASPISIIPLQGGETLVPSDISSLVDHPVDSYPKGETIENYIGRFSVGRPSPLIKERRGIVKQTQTARLVGSRQAEMTLFGKRSQLRTGSGKIILLEVGFGTVPSDYDPLAERLANEDYLVALAKPKDHGHFSDALEYRSELYASYAEYLLATVGDRLHGVGYSMGDLIMTRGQLMLANSRPTDMRTGKPQGIESSTSLLGFGHEEARIGLLGYTGRLGKSGVTETTPATLRHPVRMARFAIAFARDADRLLAEGVALTRTGSEAHKNHLELQQKHNIPSYHITARRDALVKSSLVEKPDAIIPVFNHLAPISHPRETTHAITRVLKSADKPLARVG